MTSADVFPLEGTPAVVEYYDRKKYWPAESLARRDALLAKIAAQTDARAR